MLIRDALYYGKNYLRESKSPFLDSLVLLQNVTCLTKEKILLSNELIPNDLFDNFCRLLKLRKENMPIQYIIQRAEFMGLKFYVDENVLIPRSDTEILVETVINFIGNKKLNVLDLCSGSGCISIALKKFCPNINIIGIDISQKAIDIANKNAAINNVNVEFECGDIFEKFISNIPPMFDIIISNPPYIISDKINNLDANVKDFEPKIALDGGEDGLDFYRFITQKINHRCEIFFEIGYDQAKSVCYMLNTNGFGNIKVIKDLAGLDRVIYANRE
jgi:protein-(glutamine-N5) methyltransferase, release factor-specific